MDAGCCLPMVPRPPILKRPNRRKGAEQVIMLGVTLRITITLSGFWGINLEDILRSAIVEVAIDVRASRA